MVRERTSDSRAAQCLERRHRHRRYYWCCIYESAKRSKSSARQQEPQDSGNLMRELAAPQEIDVLVRPSRSLQADRWKSQGGPFWIVIVFSDRPCTRLGGGECGSTLPNQLYQIETWVSLQSFYIHFRNIPLNETRSTTR